MAKPGMASRRRASRFVGWGERVATGAGIVAVCAMVVWLTYFRFSPVGIGSSQRSPEEQRRLLASGDCAIAPNQAVLGKVVGQLGPSQSRPRGGYMLESIDRRRVLQVEFDDIRLVPCRSLER